MYDVQEEGFAIQQHGVHNEQEFQGAGTSFTPYDYCTTGIGDSESAAFEDALEQAAMGGDLPSHIMDELEVYSEGQFTTTDKIALVAKEHYLDREDLCDHHVYCTIYWKA